MARSMTGYAAHSVEIGGKKWGFEIRSVNHRFLDLGLRMPSFLNPFEADIRSVFSKELKRGKVNLFINVDQGASSKQEINTEVLVPVLKQLQKFKKEQKLAGDIQIGDLLRTPGVFAQEDRGAFPKKDLAALKVGLQKMLELFLKMKEKEGKSLESDICSRILVIKKNLSQIESQKAAITKTHQARLKERINQFLDGTTLDEERLMKEVAISLEKMDITEEIVRLSAHLKLFTSTLKKKLICGKDLDFVIQEMNRETNTIASKIQNKDIGHLAIGIKSEIEKIREQIQNIE